MKQPPAGPVGARASSLPGFLAGLSFRDFRRLWAGALFSSLGTWTQDVALAWLIYTRLGNPAYLGFRTLAAEAPLLAFMLIGGAIADRVDRRKILLASQLIQMSCAVVLGLLYALDRLGIGAILLLAFVAGLAQSQSAPAYQAALISLVPARAIPNAVALNSLQYNLSRTVGPVIAGVLLAQVGTGACFAANAVSFLAVIVALHRIRIPSLAAPPPESLRRSLVTGLRHAWGDPSLSLLIGAAAAISFLGFPLVTYLPVIADRVLGTGATGYSLLLSSFGAGAIFGAVASAQRGHAPRRGRVLLVSLAAFGSATLGVAVSASQVLSMALLAVAGFSLVSASSTLSSLVQEGAPEALRGRVMSIHGLAFRGGNPLGSVAAGMLIGPAGVSAVIGGFGVALVGVFSAAYWRRPALRAL